MKVSDLFLSVKIASMKADIDNRNTHTDSHLKMNLKKIQVEEESKAIIDNQNKALLKRVSRIMRERGSLDNWNETYKPRSLNRRIRSYEATKIQDENVHIVRRLSSIKPLYNAKKWENDFVFHEYVLQNMRSTTKDFETIPNLKSPRTSPREEKRESRKSPTRRIHLPKIGMKGDQSPLGMKEFNASREAQLLHDCNTPNGVDIGVLIHSLALRNFRERMQICSAYEKLFNDKLEKTLHEYTHSSFHNIITALLSTREMYDARTIRATLEARSLDNWRENSLIELICTRHDLALEAIKQAYIDEFDKEMSKDIHDLTTGDLQSFLTSLLLHERSTNMEIDEERCVEDAHKLITSDIDGRWTCMEPPSHFARMISEEGYAQIRAAFVEYEKLSSLDVEGSVKSARDAHRDNKQYWDALLAFVRCLRNCPAFFATCLHQSVVCLSKPKSKAKLQDFAEKTIIRCVVTRSEADFPQICRIYAKKYGMSLYSDINTHCNFSYKPLLLEMLKHHGRSKKKSEKRIAGMVIPGPPTKSVLTRPPPTNKLTPEDFRNNPLNKSQQNLCDTSGGKRRQHAAHYQDMSATVRQCRDFNSEKDAEVLHNALKNWQNGDHKPLLNVLSRRSNDQRQKICLSYASKFKSDLLSDVQQSLNDAEYSEVLSEWMTNRMEFDATLLQNALTNKGQEFVAMEIFCTRQPKHVKTVCDGFRKLYGSTVQEAINEHVKDSLWRKILLNLAQMKREASNGTSQNNQIASMTSKLYEETISGLSTKNFIQIFTRSNQTKIQSVLVHFHKLSGRNLEEVIKESSDYKEEDKTPMLLLIKCCKDPPSYFASVLSQVIDRKFDLLHLIRIIITRAEVDLEIIKQKYKQECKENLNVAMKPLLENKTYKEFLMYLLMH